MWFQKIKKSSNLLMVVLGTMTMFQGCLESDDDVYDGNKYLQKDIQTIENYLAANGITAPMDSTYGVFYDIHRRGSGYRTLSGVEAEAQFQGFTLDGEEFVNTFDGNPIAFTLGDQSTYVTGMTDGITIGLTILSEGDSATIYVPSPYGFQDKAFGNVPPNSVLVYHLKFVNVKRLDEEYADIDAYIADRDISASIEPEYGIRYAIHRAGNTNTPKSGAFISLHYQGELLDGTIFDSSYESNSPLSFTFGRGELLAGFEMGVSQLHENDSATIFVPSIYGYKDEARGVIPANSVLVFGVDILSITQP